MFPARARWCFEDALEADIGRTAKTLHGVQGAWVKDMNVFIENGNITGYKVNLTATGIPTPWW